MASNCGHPVIDKARKT